MKTIEKEFKVTEHLYASLNRRFANFILDIIIPFFLFLFIMFFIGITVGYPPQFFNDIMDLDYIDYLLICLMCQLIFESLFSRSLAKFITNTIVVNENGSKPSFLKILIRTFCRLIPIDAFTYLGDKTRGWHDSIPGLYVVRKDLLMSKKSFHSLEEIGQTEE